MRGNEKCMKMFQHSNETFSSEPKTNTKKHTYTRITSMSR